MCRGGGGGGQGDAEEGDGKICNQQNSSVQADG